MAEPANNTCFVIAPIGDSGSDIRKRSDQILKFIIAPAAIACGYDEPIRADKIDESGFITNQVIQHLIEDAIVVADLTGENPNVFYELAVRHAFRKPVIQLMQVGQKPPFDVNGLRTVNISHTDLEIAESAKQQIIHHMTAIRKKPGNAESPVSVAVDLAALKGGNPQQRELAQVHEGIAALTRLVRGVDENVRLLASVESLRGAHGPLAYKDVYRDLYFNPAGAGETLLTLRSIGSDVQIVKLEGDDDPPKKSTK
jgi:hypothetical protein